MAKPYWYKQAGGFVHIGDRLHREEIKTINAQLAAPISWPNSAQLEPGLDVMAHIAARPRPRYNRKYTSTILERLQCTPEALQNIAQIALKSAIPEHWNLNKTPIDGAQELHREQRISLLQSLGELALEETAA